MMLTTQWMLAAALFALGAGDEQRILIEQALDRPATLTITDAPLPDAFRTIALNTGVGVSIGPETMALLPYGEATRVSLQSQGNPLHEGLTALCNTIGMEYQITDSGVEILPTPALHRLGRTASWEELSTLTMLRSTHWKGDDDDEFEEIEKKIRFDGVPGKLDDNREDLGDIAEKSGSGSADDVLTRACAKMNCTWIPWADEILVMSQARFAEYQMQRIVSLRYHYATLAEVVRGLSRQAGVPIHIEPAAAATLSDREKNNLSLVAENVTVAEALEQIALTTGLAYETTEDGVRLHRPAGVANMQVVNLIPENATANEPTDTASRRPRDPIVGKVIITSPDGKHTYEWFIRESDLTAEERDELERIKRAGIAAMRRDLGE